MIRAEIDRDDLIGVCPMNWCPGERPFDDLDDVIGREETNQHAKAERDNAFNQHPAEILKVLEKSFDRSAFGLFAKTPGILLASHAGNSNSSFRRVRSL